MTVVLIFAVIGGFAVGLFFGLGFVLVADRYRIGYHTKRECRECLRTRVEYGFHVDGKQYKCVEDPLPA